MRRLAVVLAGLLLLAGCGTPFTATTGGAETAPPLPGTFNDTDVMFLQMMVPSHEQGVEMARLAARRAGDADVRELAAAVEVTQQDEIGEMARRLRAWHQPVAADPNPGAHAGHGGMHATDPAFVETLRATPAGPDFDRDFLNLLTGQQLGAVELARMETGRGKDSGARDLAERIVKSRTAQIKQMARMLAR
jgi:uncharacterized protein (DUF305 family)